MFYMVKEHNNNPERTFDMEINHFADKLESELNFGAIPPPLEVPSKKELSASSSYLQYIPTANLTFVNWYNDSRQVVSPVAD